MLLLPLRFPNVKTSHLRPQSPLARPPRIFLFVEVCRALGIDAWLFHRVVLIGCFLSAQQTGLRSTGCSSDLMILSLNPW
jgi:hypothetical protein